MWELLKENVYQKGIISVIFQIIANNHRLSQSQQQTPPSDIQEEEEEDQNEYKFTVS